MRATKTCHRSFTTICEDRSSKSKTVLTLILMGLRYTYNPSTSKWSLLTINAKKKKMGGSKKRRAKQAAAVDPDAMAVDEDVDMDAAVVPEEDDSDDEPVSYIGSPCNHELNILYQDQKMAVDGKTESGETTDAPVLPLTRSNAMIAVLKNTLYM